MLLHYDLNFNVIIIAVTVLFCMYLHDYFYFLNSSMIVSGVFYLCAKSCSNSFHLFPPPRFIPPSSAAVGGGGGCCRHAPRTQFITDTKLNLGCQQMCSEQYLVPPSREQLFLFSR